MARRPMTQATHIYNPNLLGATSLLFGLVRQQYHAGVSVKTAAKRIAADLTAHNTSILPRAMADARLYFCLAQDEQYVSYGRAVVDLLS